MPPRVSTLQYLMLAGSNSGMGHLPASIFKNLSQLRSLNLESAGLHSLGPEVFHNLAQLKELCLAKNELRTLDVTLAMDLLLLNVLLSISCLGCVTQEIDFMDSCNPQLMPTGHREALGATGRML